jgi:cell division protein FtsB
VTLEEMIVKKETKIEELSDEVNKLEVFVDHYKDEIVRLKEKA